MAKSPSPIVGAIELNRRGGLSLPAPAPSKSKTQMSPMALDSPSSTRPTSPASSAGASDSLSPPSSVSSDATSGSKLSSNFPSPFYPPTLARIEGVAQKYKAPALPAEYPPLPSTETPLKGDDKDVGTPDEWVVRDERLVRLTGKWPFNCEAPLPDLWNAVSPGI